ncbi:hypothetical protein [Sulfitobacter dubius]|jgi:hypothetical protein|uniref:hypothetical protein n=1 Tax=Sulfitobacter dubius TaxID=218673 RepID=UPI0026C5BA69
MKTQIDDSEPQDMQDLDPASLSAIRNLVKGDQEADAEGAAAGRKVTPTATSQKPAVKPRSAGRKAFPDLSESETTKQKSGKHIALKLPKWRPSPRVIILAALALLVVLRPLLMLGLIFLTVFITLGVFIALGYDGFWQRAMALGRWYSKRRPERADRMRARLDAFAMKWDAVLDCFPEGTVDGLYLPDFGEMAAADVRHDEALDRRFDKLRNSEA